MNLGLGSSLSRWRCAVLGAWAAGIAVLLIAGRYSLFIRARLWPLLLVSLLIILFFLVAMIARPAPTGSGKIKLAAWIRGAMLLLPLFCMSSLLTGKAASGLNSFALAKRSLGLGSPTDALDSAGDADATAGDASKVVSLGYIVNHLHGLSGTHVVTEARVFRDKTLPAGQIAVYRFIVVCCAADAMPVEVVVNSPKTAGLQNDDWVRVGGILHVQVKDGERIPVIEADQIDPIAAPAEPYLSPFRF